MILLRKLVAGAGLKLSVYKIDLQGKFEWQDSLIPHLVPPKENTTQISQEMQTQMTSFHNSTFYQHKRPEGNTGGGCHLQLKNGYLA